MNGGKIFKIFVLQISRYVFVNICLNAHYNIFSEGM